MFRNFDAPPVGVERKSLSLCGSRRQREWPQCEREGKTASKRDRRGIDAARLTDVRRDGSDEKLPPARDALQPAPIGLMRRFLQMLHTAGRAAEPAAEVPNCVAPGLARDPTVKASNTTSLSRRFMTHPPIQQKRHHRRLDTSVTDSLHSHPNRDRDVVGTLIAAAEKIGRWDC